MEEARQHTALKALYFLSAGCWLAALLLLVFILVAKLPAAGPALVLLMFAALLCRTAYQWMALVTLKSAPNRRMMAVNTGTWSVIATAFFVFVVLHQFGILD